ncbi:response regulator transcription factor [Clostridium niameyense]|uniref:Stage 0 sporulation protein A homolog n=1 Tax=Clostridium niameyense TaxID=1622073 RepID=A0A6M0RBQ3_9CLOT|nr:response regulator transcription factor [Clostridium niameyense]NEZ47741.1 response regulator transcription factor [Clostridium niameyense]
MRILIAEDKQDIANLIKVFLQKEGYEVILAKDGQEAFDFLLNDSANLCIFDIMMPKMDGFTLIQKVREFSNVPILVLTAKNMEQDKILGLDLGADDYITKPFSSLELVSRVNAHLRRNYKMNNSNSIIKYGNLKIDQEKYIVYKNGIDCLLTAMEYKLLFKLISSPERVFTKSQLYKAVCNNYIEGDENTIPVHISRLRDKIELDPKVPQYIKTIRGLGYKIEKK